MAEHGNLALRSNVERLQPTAPFIVFERVGKSFATRAGDRVEAARNISFTVRKNEFVTIVGPSGCGKSTLLKMVSGLTRASSGRILVNGQPITDPVPEIGMVLQRPALLPWRDVLGNVLLPAVILGMERTQAEARARELLSLVGLADFASKYPNELSGGMQQRVAICRALLCQPSLLLMDEPFAALDALTREELSAELERIWETEPKTVLFVTHSIFEAVLLADRVVIMTARPGSVADIIDIAIPRPRDLGTAQRADFQEYAASIRAAIRPRSE